MSEENYTPGDGGNIEEIESQLTEGLKSCRSLVANYRSVLAGGSAASDSASVMGERDSDSSGRRFSPEVN